MSASLDDPLREALALAKEGPVAPPGGFRGRGSWQESLREGLPPGAHDVEGSALKRARLVGRGSGRITARAPSQQLPGAVRALPGT